MTVSRRRIYEIECRGWVDSTSSTFAKAAIKLIQDRLVTPVAGLGYRAEVQVERIAMTGIKLSSHRPAKT